MRPVGRGGRACASWARGPEFHSQICETFGDDQPRDWRTVGISLNAYFIKILKQITLDLQNPLQSWRQIPFISLSLLKADFVLILSCMTGGRWHDSVEGGLGRMGCFVLNQESPFSLHGVQIHCYTVESFLMIARLFSYNHIKSEIGKVEA